MRTSETAVFPGSFDPLTNGHIDIIRRALGIFEKVVVGVLQNPQKLTLFSLEERSSLIKGVFADYKDRLSVASFSGLLVNFMQEQKARLVVRGLRAVSDYDYEAQMALLNKNLCDDIETLFLVTREENSYISSSMVKQVAFFGGDVSRFVAPEVE
jgi:pantetheine-phosphate adenylyltransferase